MIMMDSKVYPLNHLNKYLTGKLLVNQEIILYIRQSAKIKVINIKFE